MLNELYAISQRRKFHSDCLLAALKGRYDLMFLNGALRFLDYMTEGSYTMAKKIAENKGKTKKKAEFKGFANVDLSPDEKAEMKEWIRDLEAVHIELDEMAAAGYKFSVARSEAMNSYQATAFCQDSDSPNAGYILSAFAPHWLDALGCVAYKHAIKCEGIWPNKDSDTPDLWG